MLFWWFVVVVLERTIAMDYLKPKPGRACQQSQVARVADEKDPTSYFTCSPKDNKVYVWTRQKCEKRGEVFVAKLQKCRSKTVVKRQESLCRSQPNSPVCQQIQCPTSTTSHVAPGAPCDWVSAPLEPYATSPNYFLQCNPSPVSSGCGVWNQMQCSNGTVFSMFVQICVTVTISQASCPLGEIGMFPCGTDNWCPSGAQCRDGVCCQSAIAPQPQPPGPEGYPAPPTLYPQPQATTTQAPGGYFTPPPNIYQPQPQPGMPLSGIPQPQPGLPNMPQPQPGLPQPPGPPGSQPLPQPFPQPPSPPAYPQSQVYSGALPFQPGYPQPQMPSPQGYLQPDGTYPQQPQPQTGSFPQTQSQGAIPLPQNQGSFPRPQSQYPQPPVYPQQPQSQGFPPGIFPQPAGSGPVYPQQPYYPQQPGWPGSYPLPPAPGYPQPFTQQPPTLYPLTSNPPNMYYSTPANLPFCPEGQLASTFCKDNYDCPENQFCSNGGCCPLSKCPNGVLAVSHCHDLHDCLPNQFCYNNGCCAVQSCPNGEMPSKTCDDKNPCPSSFTCQSGGCCSSSLPDCPNGDSASMPCSGPGTCPSGQFCHTDKGGYKHGCCDIPKCPNGMPAIQPCGADYSCPNGLQCLNNACCAVPTQAPQTTAAISTQQPLTQGPVYPSPTQGLVYPPPTLPGPYPTQSLVTPSRYCYNCCPRLQVAVCFCNNFNLCPQMTTCGTQGTCCATRDALPHYVSAKRPGDRCYADTECPGFDTGSGRCASGYCVCLPGTVSNGFTCVRYGQSPYRRYGKKRRQGNGHSKRIRREIISDLFSNGSSSNTFENFDDILIGEDDLVYWKTFGQTNCITDNECIPEMACVNGKCEEIVDKLNDNGCIDDEHCNKSIPFSVCRPRWQDNHSLSNRTIEDRVCVCDDEHLEFKHKCWKECPSGTIQQDKKCLMKKSSEKDQRKNQDTLNEISL